jgi:5-formyltetrahydrofolate cyclo-ligase
MHIRDEKALLRTRIAERAKRQSPHEREAESRSIGRRILENLPEGKLTICAYWPMPNEADIRGVITAALEKGHRIFLPRFTRGFFEFRQIESVSDLAPGKFGLLEPPAGSPILDLHDVSVVLLPAIGFDRSGNRLGRGNGGYDRWLTELKKVNPTALIWGIALEHQLTESVPTEAHDQKVDAIMTGHLMIVPNQTTA